MPSPRRRTGSRRGAVPSELRAAIQSEVRRLDGLEDAAEAVRAVGDFYAELDFELEALADARLRAVRRLRRDGWTYVQIAEETGLSITRVGQLARATSAGGRSALRRT